MFVQLSMFGQPIGKIEFQIVNYDEGIVHITDIKLPEKPMLRNALIKQLTTNKMGVSILGGTRPTNIGRYADGILMSLQRMEDDWGFDFDPQYLPMPVEKPGVIY